MQSLITPSTGRAKEQSITLKPCNVVIIYCCDKSQQFWVRDPIKDPPLEGAIDEPLTKTWHALRRSNTLMYQKFHISTIKRCVKNNNYIRPFRVV
jgi:hypothetical protein